MEEFESIWSYPGHIGVFCIWFDLESGILKKYIFERDSVILYVIKTRVPMMCGFGELFKEQKKGDDASNILNIAMFDILIFLIFDILIFTILCCCCCVNVYK